VTRATLNDCSRSFKVKTGKGVNVL